MEKIKDKKIVLVGASGSIGSHTAKLLSAGGADLYITGHNAERLHRTAKDCGISANKVFELDITNEEQVQTVTDAILRQSGGIEVLIIASGIGVIKPIELLTTEDFLKSQAVNLTGPFMLTKAFLPVMKEQKKGLIINIPGILGKTPMAGAVAYSASKYGLNGMMKSLREELKRTEIRITQLFLGGVDSDFWNEIDLRVQRDKMIQAEEAAKAIWFLCQQPISGVVSEMVIQPFNHQVI